MPSASSGRYQSKLFNFVHQQSRRFTEQCDRTFRHLQFTTSGVATALLYPLYLLFQSTRSAAKQLHRAVQQDSPQLPENHIDSQYQTSPTADTPIQTTLLLVNTLPFLEEDLSLTEEASSTLSPAKEPLNFLAFLASLRFKLFPNSHTSALVETERDTRKQREHSPLTPHPSPLAPHSSLSRNRPVIRGIATQQSSRTLVLVTAQNEILDILTPQQQQRLQERIIGEVAKYWRYQRLAHSVEQQRNTGLKRLFKGQNTGGRETEELPRHQVLAFLDRTIAEVESNHLAPVSVAKTSLSFPSTLGKRSWELVQRLQTQLSTSLSSSKSPAITPDAETRTLRIQALIWAAVDYFFGRSRKHLKQTTLHLPTGSKPQGKPLPHRRSAAKLSSTWSPPSPHDPWLTLSDLFGDSAESGEPSTPDQPKLSKSQTINKVSSASEISAQPDTQSTQLEPAPDWIETNATNMGYVRHPLEQLLALLDRAMLWLERFSIKVWRWVKNSFK
ncbi:hypothetical protein [Chroococcidiopsis sp. CCMEE 29]|uniref:hypothetical protein n=1 Tax=Chroococcidiopsis sp. CCMEE 29 TaxID=155894 RepID=UPI002021DD6D|nr:hypothetical protein [Chroococcidiopsis sp. CCMEE 29]